MIDKVCKEEANSFILFDPDVVKGLYSRGLIYFDVPVYPDDRFKGVFWFYFLLTGLYFQNIIFKAMILKHSKFKASYLEQLHIPNTL